MIASKQHVLILGAGFAGLELATRLSESLADQVRVTLIDRNDAFVFGFSKLAVMFGERTADEVRLPYSALHDGIDFRQETITGIDPQARRVTTDAGSYEADFIVVAMGADYDVAATPGLAEGGFEFYSVAGAERACAAIEDFQSGRVVIGIMGHPFKCPPAPFEVAFLLDDELTRRGIREQSEILVVGPMAAPVPITKEVSRVFLEALADRSAEYLPKRNIVSVDAAAHELEIEGGERIPYDLLLGVPVHRAPEVVRQSELTDDDWVPVDRANLRTRFDRVYAPGDIAALPMAKAGVFAEAAAKVVADDIAAQIRGEQLERPYEGDGHCYLEFGGGTVASVEANFLGGPEPVATVSGPSRELAGGKAEFAAEHRRRWF